MRLFVLGIDGIDDVHQQFTMDMFFNAGWQDPRLALPEDQRSGQIRSIPLDKIWTPRLLIVNDRGLSFRLPLVAEVDDGGNVQYRQRVAGTLAFDSQLDDFPFDTQRLKMDFISYRFSPDEVRFSPDSSLIDDRASFSAEGWEFRLIEPEFGEFKIPTAGIARPRLTYFIEAQRDAQYYLLTLFLPMSLIVFMSWTVFWLQPDIVGPRIAISTASIFSLIAFGFSIRLSLPRVSYMTLADIFVIGCTLMVFLALGAAVIGSRWANADYMDRALRVNAIARWAYVGLYCLVVTAVLII